MILNGRKHIRLYGSDIENMYPNPLGSKGRTIQSQIDCNNPDLELYPSHANAVCHEVIYLLIPKWNSREPKNSILFVHHELNNSETVWSLKWFRIEEK